MEIKMTEFLEDRKKAREAVLRYAFIKMTGESDEAEAYDEMNDELAGLADKYEDTYLQRMRPKTWEV